MHWGGGHWFSILCCNACGSRGSPKLQEQCTRGHLLQGVAAAWWTRKRVIVCWECHTHLCGSCQNPFNLTQQKKKNIVHSLVLLKKLHWNEFLLTGIYKGLAHKGRVPGNYFGTELCKNSFLAKEIIHRSQTSEITIKMVFQTYWLVFGIH